MAGALLLDRERAPAGRHGAEQGEVVGRDDLDERTARYTALGHPRQDSVKADTPLNDRAPSLMST